MKDISSLYKAILDRSIDPLSLSNDEKDSLFDYLCGELEKGNEVDSIVLQLCAPSKNCSVEDAERIIEKAYLKLASLYSSRRNARRTAFLRRALAAAVAVCSFVVFTLVTASAFGLDFVDHIKTLFHEEESKPEQKDYVFFESYGEPMKKYESIDELFTSELKNYYYPSYLPEGVRPYLVAKKQGEEAIVTCKLKDENGKCWTITARSAENAYLPMGYKYETATLDGKDVTFVYTLSRSKNEITQYTVYTVIDNVMYTQNIPIGDWETVKLYLDSFTKSE